MSSLLPYSSVKAPQLTLRHTQAARMFGLAVDDSVPSGNDSDEEQQQNVHHEPSPAANGAPLKEKWCVDPAFLPPEGDPSDT